MTNAAVSSIAAPRVLLLPGWQNSGEAHWQTAWERLYADHRVEQDDWQWPKRGDWMARLEEELLSTDAPAVLVAHSLGCHLVTAWASHSRHTERVCAALLVAPPDIESDASPIHLPTWRPILRTRLPFRSTAIASTNDPYCTPERASDMAEAWGSDFVSIGARGHINGDSGLGDWPQGREMLKALMAAAR